MTQLCSKFECEKFDVKSCVWPYIEWTLALSQWVMIGVPNFHLLNTLFKGSYGQKPELNATIYWNVTIMRFQSMSWHARFDVKSCAWPCIEWIHSLSQWLMIRVPNFPLLIAPFKGSYYQKPELKCDDYLMTYAHALPINVLTHKIWRQNLRANVNENMHYIFTADEVRSAKF